MVLVMSLLDITALLFFSTYTLLVLFWAEIYYQARGLSVGILRPAYFIINGLMFAYGLFVQLSHQYFAIELTKLFFAVVSFFAALGFVIYGGRLHVMLRRFPIESKGGRNKLNEEPLDK